MGEFAASLLTRITRVPWEDGSYFWYPSQIAILPGRKSDPSVVFC